MGLQSNTKQNKTKPNLRLQPLVSPKFTLTLNEGFGINSLVLGL